MSEPNIQLYHCSKCNSVFKAPVPFPSAGVCAHCERSPFSEQDFNSISQMKKVMDSDVSHGVPGHDVADFVSMQKVKRQRQGKWAIVLWVSLLVVGGGVVFYNREIEKPIVEEPSEFVKQESKYQETLAQSSGEAFKVFNKFMLAGDASEKSEYVIGGVRKILNIEQKKDSVDILVPRPPLRLLANSYSDDGELPRVEFILEDKGGRRFEVVMWKDGSKWLLDWEQYVRYAQDDWSRFLASERIGNPKEFRLYVRRRHMVSGREREKLQLIFYRPKMVPGERTQESPSVEVAKKSPFFAQLEAAFNENLSKKNEVQTDVVGRLDTAGLLRVKVILDWQQESEGEPIVVLKALTAMHWLELDPGTASTSQTKE